MIENNRNKLDYSYKKLKNIILEKKNKIKNVLLENIIGLDDDQRKIDNMERSLKIGEWGKGSGSVYSSERYDKEYEERISRFIEKDELDMSSIKEDNDSFGEEQEEDYEY